MLLPVREKYEKYVKISLVSFIILFLELLLIRLVSTELRIFAYLSNIILLAIFVGSGLGMFFKTKLSVLWSLASLLLVVVILISGLFLKITDFLSPISESFIWFQSSWDSLFSIVLGLVMTLILIGVVVAVFVPLGQFLGSQFDDSEHLIKLYSLNIIFSLLGILTFNLFSFINLSPYLAILISFVLLFLILEKKETQIGLAIIFVTIPLLLVYTFATKDITWSPYQKLSIKNMPTGIIYPTGFMLQVNNIGYMGLLDLSTSHKENVKKIIEDNNIEITDLDYRNQYDLPYIIKPDVKDVLIIGAGGGNDAAGALRADVDSIDAVEIDPRIIDYGKELHPEKPYISEKVNLINDDGRSHLKKTEKKYDLVVLGLVDSHTLGSSLNNVQLDNYLYTKESIKDIYNVLKPDGILVLSFDVRREWIGSRLKDNITEAFGAEPHIFSMQSDLPIFGWGGVFFAQSKTEGILQTYLDNNPGLNEFLTARKLDISSSDTRLTDDWPFLYLDKPRIPTLHILISAILITAFYGVFKLSKIEGNLDNGSFLLGAGFMLYEFQSISKSALIYGNTWVTNTYTISAILIFILLANIIASKIKMSFKLMYALLLAAFILQLAIPLSLFNEWGTAAKYVIAPLMLNLPLFFSGLIFINLFKKSKNEKTFFASNLLGSAVGGLLGFFSYLLGMQSLLYISLSLYLFSFVFIVGGLKLKNLLNG